MARSYVRNFATEPPGGGARISPAHDFQIILEALATGRSDKQIAALYDLSPASVRTYVKRSYKKLHVTEGRTEGG